MGGIAVIRYLPSDVFRCVGWKNAHCDDCARRLQLEHDDPTRYFPYMSPPYFESTCTFKRYVTRENPAD